MPEETTAALAGPIGAEQGEGELDEIVAGAGHVEERAEQHEEEDVIGRHPQGDAGSCREPLFSAFFWTIPPAHQPSATTRPTEECSTT